MTRYLKSDCGLCVIVYVVLMSELCCSNYYCESHQTLLLITTACTCEVYMKHALSGLCGTSLHVYTVLVLYNNYNIVSAHV